jgi:zinc-ribbon domain
MFCPKCATQNLDGASFCRSCGANISLVPQALAGLPVQQEYEDSRTGRRARRRSKELSLDHSFKNIFMGIAFLIVAIALSRSIGAGWWFWMLLPAFSMMGTGVAQYIRIREQEKKNILGTPPRAQSFPDRFAAPQSLSSSPTGEMRPPVPSVTEGTTRHLGVEAPSRQPDAERK